MTDYSEPSFLLFSMEHMAAIGVLCLSIFLLFISRKRWSVSPKHERLFALIFIGNGSLLSCLDDCNWKMGTERFVAARIMQH